MAGREKEVVRHLSEKDLDRLLTAADDIKEYKRLVFINRLYKGATLAEAADDIGKSEGTATNWVRRWNDGGLGKLTPNFGGGQPPKLDETEQEALIDRLREGQPWKNRKSHSSLTQSSTLSIIPTISRRS